MTFSINIFSRFSCINIRFLNVSRLTPVSKAFRDIKCQEMDQRQQPGRVAKRKSDDVEFDDDHYDEMDDLQERLDRILGSDSDAESEYTPDKDSQTEDGEEVYRETKTKNIEKNQDDVH